LSLGRPASADMSESQAGALSVLTPKWHQGNLSRFFGMTTGGRTKREGAEFGSPFTMRVSSGGRRWRKMPGMGAGEGVGQGPRGEAPSATRAARRAAMKAPERGSPGSMTKRVPFSRR